MARPKNPDALTPAARTKLWRAARRERGGRELNVSLTPENAAKLDRMAAGRGENVSLSGLINELVALA